MNAAGIIAILIALVALVCVVYAARKKIGPFAQDEDAKALEKFGEIAE